MTSLPDDPQNPDHAWCDSCQQSISKSRAAAHLVSAKHSAKTQKSSKSSGLLPLSEAELADVPKDRVDTHKDRVDEQKAAPAAPAATSSTKSNAKGHGLPQDPDKPGHYWCGLCQVSLAPSKADGHLETTRHISASTKHISSVVKSTKAK